MLDLLEASIADLQAGLSAGDFTSVDLVKVGLPAHTLLLRADVVDAAGLHRPHRGGQR